MSQVQYLGCPVCNPDSADRGGIRRVINITSSELFAFVNHFVEQHYTPEVTAVDHQARDEAAEAQTTANEALNIANRLTD